jgi:hypothetical protein
MPSRRWLPFAANGFTGEQIGLVTCTSEVIVQENALARADAAGRRLGTALASWVSGRPRRTSTRASWSRAAPS